MLKSLSYIWSFLLINTHSAELHCQTHSMLCLFSTKDCNNNRMDLTLAKDWTAGKPTVNQLMKESHSRRGLWRWMLVLTRGLNSECCGEERTSMGMPRAGLVPEPLLPANWPQGSWQSVKTGQKERRQSCYFVRMWWRTILAQSEREGEDITLKFESDLKQCTVKWPECKIHSPGLTSK